VRKLGAVAEPIDFGLDVPDSATVSAQRMLSELGAEGRYAVINPSAGAQGKRWPPERFAAITDLLEQRGMPAVLVGHALDAPLEEAIARSAKSPLRSLVGRTDLKELTAVLARSAVHLSGDTGSAHLAAALGVPVISLYGPTDPFRSGPYGQLDKAISRFGREPAQSAIAAILVDEVWALLEPFATGVHERV
jgi:ADP-heptose:LPS heptosyltransferase